MCSCHITLLNKGKHGITLLICIFVMVQPCFRRFPIEIFKQKSWMSPQLTPVHNNLLHAEANGHRMSCALPHTVTVHIQQSTPMLHMHYLSVQHFIQTSKEYVYNRISIYLCEYLFQNWLAIVWMPVLPLVGFQEFVSSQRYWNSSNNTQRFYK